MRPTTGCSRHQPSSATSARCAESRGPLVVLTFTATRHISAGVGAAAAHRSWPPRVLRRRDDATSCSRSTRAHSRRRRAIRRACSSTFCGDRRRLRRFPLRPREGNVALLPTSSRSISSLTARTDGGADSTTVQRTAIRRALAVCGAVTLADSMLGPLRGAGQVVLVTTVRLLGVPTAMSRCPISSACLSAVSPVVPTPAANVHPCAQPRRRRVLRPRLSLVCSCPPARTSTATSTRRPSAPFAVLSQRRKFSGIDGS